ncbi:unnamed protein product [Diamesa tonsa]
MASLRGWRFFGLTITILLYVAGILVLSIVNLQNPQQRRNRNGRFYNNDNHEIGIVKKAPLQWCSELKFMGSNEIPFKQKQSDTPNEFKTGNVVALVSFPGSGNTWLRYLLQQATGILTGSVYKDFGLLKSGFPAESISNSSVLTVKTHEWGEQVFNKFNKAILLVRDPAKSIIAEFNRQNGGHVGFASPDRYKRTKGRYWTQFVTNKLWSWEQTNLSWAKNFTGDILIIYFDNLVENVEKSLKDILNFLEFPINDDLLACALLRKEGIYRRKKRLLPFDPYTSTLHKMIDDKRSEVYLELERLRKPKSHI